MLFDAALGVTEIKLGRKLGTHGYEMFLSIIQHSSNVLLS